MEKYILKVYFHLSLKMPKHQNSVDLDTRAHCMAIIQLFVPYSPSKILQVHQYESFGKQDGQFFHDNVVDKLVYASPMKYIFDLPNPNFSFHRILDHFQKYLSEAFISCWIHLNMSHVTRLTLIE